MATLDRSLLWSPYLQSTSCLLIDFLLVEINLLNSSPIDELGEGAYERAWWCQVKCERQAGYTGIHGNPESGKNP